MNFVNHSYSMLNWVSGLYEYIFHRTVCAGRSRDHRAIKRKAEPGHNFLGIVGSRDIQLTAYLYCSNSVSTELH